MAIVYIPSQWRDLTGAVDSLELPGRNLRDIAAGLEARFPGIAERLVEGDAIAAGLAASIDGAVASRGMHSPVGTTSEIHFLPAIGGG